MIHDYNFVLCNDWITLRGRLRWTLPKASLRFIGPSIPKGVSVVLTVAVF